MARLQKLKVKVYAVSQWLRGHLDGMVRETFGIAGGLLICRGVWMIYPPASYIFAGVLCILVAWGRAK